VTAKSIRFIWCAMRDAKGVIRLYLLKKSVACSDNNNNNNNTHTNTSSVNNRALPIFATQKTKVWSYSTGIPDDHIVLNCRLRKWKVAKSGLLVEETNRD
jgi:hypothetical protein